MPARSNSRAGGSRGQSRAAFTMMEALLAITIATVAGMAMLASVQASMQASDEALIAALGWGLGEQLLDEIAAVRFPTGTGTAPGTSVPRANYDDIDDFAQWTASPPVDRYGRKIGAEGSGTSQTRPSSLQANLDQLARFRQSIRVERLQPSGTNSWTVVTPHTNYRRVTVSIDYTDARGQKRTVATLTRMFAYVPPGP